MKRQLSIYRPYQRVVALIVCIAMLASYFPKQVWDILFSPAYAAPITTLPLQTPTTPISPLAAPSAFGMTSPINEMLQSTNLPEEFEHLSQMGLLMPNGEPNGILMDAGAFQSAMQQKPSSLVNPISVSRVQSAYRTADTISNTLVISFTVTNNRPPAITPSTLPVSATITDTIEAISAIDFENDPNTIRNVLLTNELTNIESFVQASHPADRKGTQLAFNLGHIAPLSSVSVTLSIEVPSDVADFTQLDSGAKVWGTLQSRMVKAQAYPATLAPNTIDGQPIGEWLKWTVDANFYDEYMLEQAAELGQEPIDIFEYVRSLGYESYKGSLRGTRGTLWSQAGNSLDQASLLIAMLRASGIPARYRHGILQTTQAQELILSMFPEPTQVIGHIPADVEVSDPANEPQLLDETQDHWWVEAYIPGSGWQDLDPSFASAVIGQSFVPAGNVAIDGTDRIAEVPDSLRHKVTMKVKVETYYSLSSLNGDLAITYPLTATFNAVELVGKPVTLNHLVNSTGEGGFAFGVIRHSYIPLFLIGDQVIQGQAYQEMMTNFPFGNVLVTGEWLIIEINDLTGKVESHKREIVDRIGFDTRQNGGALDIGQDLDGSPIINDFDIYNVTIGLEISEKFYDIHIQDLKKYIEILRALPDYQTIHSLPFDEQRQAIHQMQRMFMKMASAMGNKFYIESSKIIFYNRYILVKRYTNAPRIAIVSINSDYEQTQMSIDLIRNKTISIAAPNQNAYMQKNSQFTSGLYDSIIESIILPSDLGEMKSIGIQDVFREAKNQEIKIVELPPVAKSYDIASELNISNESKSRIISALNKGKNVITPVKMVLINSKKTLMWLEIDPETGSTISTSESGTHQGLISNAITYTFVYGPAVYIFAIKFFNRIRMGKNYAFRLRCNR